MIRPAEYTWTQAYRSLYGQVIDQIKKASEKGYFFTEFYINQHTPQDVIDKIKIRVMASGYDVKVTKDKGAKYICRMKISWKLEE